MISRRAFLQAGTAAAAVAAAGVSGCSSTRSTKQDTIANLKVRPPTFVEYRGVKPDLPGNSSGVMPAFLSFPDPVQFTEAPGKGDSIEILCGVDGGAVPPPLEKNTFWQEVNKRLGAELKFNMVPATDYLTKLETVIAGDQLPEIVAVRPMPHLAQLLKAKCVDLTKHLSGDAVKDYPALANIPTRSWRSCVYNGGIYGVPLHRTEQMFDPIYRRDLTDKLGVKAEDVTDRDSFLEFCRAVTAPNEHRWAVGSITGTQQFLNQMYGVANGWRQSGGKFTNAMEEDAYPDVLDVTRKMWNEGLFYPDTLRNGLIASEIVGNGTIIFSNGGAGTAYHDYPVLYKATAPHMDLGYLLPPKWNGGGLAQYYMGSALYGGAPVCLHSDDPDRIKYLLSVMNWLASPFGTKEYKFFRYGIEGIHHTMQNGEPIVTEKGTAELNLPIRYVASGPLVTNAPGDARGARQFHDYQEKVAPLGLSSAALGLYSPTEQNVAADLQADLTDTINNIVQGRTR
ncbi:MAG TPA: extracellular solute-binding protein, partial [Mycobacteriales bacterium]|nr:extracellular solute-binding protein [Mycobacteriales bacterium]